MNNWKRFTFFDIETVKQIEKDDNGSSILKMSCTTSGRGSLITGDTEGFINFVDREFGMSSFEAYKQTVSLIHQLKERNFLCSIGHDDIGGAAILKIWNLDKTDKNDTPICVRAIKLDKAVTVTCFTILEDLSQIIIGLANGEIILIRADIFRDKVIKQKIIKVPSESPITGMGFFPLKQTTGGGGGGLVGNYTGGGSNSGPILFVVTTTHVITYHTGNKDHETIIDDEGGDIGSFTMSDEGSPIIARSDAIYFYNVEGRGPCFGFPGTKTKVLWFRSYLVVIGYEANNTNALFPVGSVVGAQGGGLGGSGVGGTNSFGSPSVVQNSKNNVLNIYDLKNKYIGFTEKFETVSHICSEWGSIFIFGADGKVFQLEEKDTQTKLETLFKKHSYQVAIDLAKSQHYDNSAIADVYREYGDRLYAKGDYDGAITQYLCTIGQLEPSYVIRKFLDAQRIHNLTSYIQALHEKNLATANHTTLLLNCYTKLKDVKKLDHFIMTDSGTFDVETAIKVCRQGNYFERALFLASKHNRHEWYLKILLEDLEEYRKALDYIQTLDWEEADKNLKKYGKQLVSEIPEETTGVLMKLCTNYQPIQAFDSLTSLNITGLTISSSATTTNTTSATHTNTNTSHSNSMSSIGGNRPKSAPEEFIHIFVSQPDWLVRFLEYMVQQNIDSKLVYNTLLELYLRDEPNLSEEDRIKRKEKAYEFLTNPNSKFDQDHALILAQVHNWKKGVLYLYEALELYNEIIEYHMENNDYDGLIKACKNYGVQDPNLWVRALSFFSTNKQNCQDEIVEVLTNIDKENLIPPLLVIQILSQNKNTTLAVIKDYISRRLSQETQQIDKDYQQIRNYADETEKMRHEINELRTNSKIFQQTKCIACGLALDLPSVHFLCQHSFHQRCLGDNERECPNCAGANKRIQEIKRSQADSANHHDQFFKLLKTSPDGFTTVSEYFGRGILN